MKLLHRRGPFILYEMFLLKIEKSFFQRDRLRIGIRLKLFLSTILPVTFYSYLKMSLHFQIATFANLILVIYYHLSEILAPNIVMI